MLCFAPLQAHPDKVGACPLCGSNIEYILEDPLHIGISPELHIEGGGLTAGWYCQCGAQGKAVFRFAGHTSIEPPPEDF